jgi:hypothetical protein
MNANRVQPGIPTGGQFTARVRDEATVQLDEHIRAGHRAHSIDALIGHFDGDATEALLALARRAGIAVAYQDRQTFEADSAH